MRFQAKYLKDRTLKIVSGSAVGSGFVLVRENSEATGRNLAVTCAHVIQDPSQLKVRNVHGQEWDAKVLHKNDVFDYAILEFAEERMSGVPEIKLGKYSELEEGDEVVFCGFPFASSNFSVHRAMISSKFVMERERKKIKLFEFDGTCNPGYSGAALLSSTTAKIYGLVTGRIGLSARMSELEEHFLHMANKGLGQIEEIEGRNGPRTINSNAMWADLLSELRSKLNVGIGYAVAIDHVDWALRRLK